MHLIETYSRTGGLRISNMEVTEHAFPLPDIEKYVIIISSSGADAKNYPYYRLVTKFLKPILNNAGYKLIQCGGQNDERVECDLDLCGKTSRYQYNWLIHNCELVLCGDTSAIHLAGHFNKKFVSLFSTSHPKISGAFFGSKENQLYLHPPDWKPNYVVQEQPKQIARIKPESVLEAVCVMLKLPPTVFQTLHLGPLYNFTSIDLVPNCIVPPQFLQGIILTIRYDKGGEEQIVYQQLQQRKCAIVTDRPLNVDILSQLRPNIEQLIYFVGLTDDFEFLKSVQRAGIPLRLVTFLSDEELNPKKLDYIDYPIIERLNNKTVPPEGVKIEPTARFKSNKRIVSRGKVYLSFGQEKLDKHLDVLENDDDNVVDCPEFWQDSDSYFIYQA